MRQISILAVIACMGVAACSGHRSRQEAKASPLPSDWRNVATQADRERLRNWRTSWTDALAQARAAGHDAEIRREGALFDPDRALTKPVPPSGDYRCRTFKLGTKGAVRRDYVAHDWFECRIDDEGEVESFHKRNGPQRPAGLVFADGEARAIFLGTLVLGDETMPLRYGQDASRDMAGIVERVAERRWRIVLPAPAFESKLDVVELVPA